MESSYDDLYTLFQQHGDVSDIFIPIDFNTGKHKGFAFVEFDERSEARKSYSTV